MIVVKVVRYNSGHHGKGEISLGQLTVTYSDVRSTQEEPAQARHCKPSQFPVVGEITDSRGRADYCHAPKPV